MIEPDFFIKKLTSTPQDIRLVWLHGWGHDHRNLLPLASLFANIAENYLLDLPGCGNSPPPSKVWSSCDYADSIIKWLLTLDDKPTYLIGHSFGCKVAMSITTKIPKKIQGLVLLAASGLPKSRPFHLRIKIFIIKWLVKFLQLFKPICPQFIQDKAAYLLGSRDYKSSQGIMRRILVNSVGEDFSSVAPQISQPILLIYGSNDTETPTSFGKKYQKLFPQAKFIEIPTANHYTILSTEHYRISELIKEFLETK